jgi:hypothetical protein
MMKYFLLCGCLLGGTLWAQKAEYFEAGENLLGLQGLRLSGVLGDPTTGNNQVSVGTDLRYGYLVDDALMVGVLVGYDYVRILSQMQVIQVNALTPALFGRYYISRDVWSLFGEVGAGVRRYLNQGASQINRWNFLYGLVGFAYRPAERVSFDLGIGYELRRFPLGINRYVARPNIGVNLHY